MVKQIIDGVDKSVDLSGYVKTDGSRDITLTSDGSFFIRDSSSNPDLVYYENTGYFAFANKIPSEKLDLYTHTLLGTEPGVTETRVSGSGIVMKNIYTTEAGWARPLMKYTDDDDVTYFALAAMGTGQALNYGYIGKAWDDTYIAWNTDGDVGMGVSYPDCKLHLLDTSGDPSLTTDDYTIFKIAGSIGSELAMGVYNDSPYGSWIQTRNSGDAGVSYPLSLNPLGGKVGIGNDDPDEMLHVTGNIKASGTIESPTITELKRYSFMLSM